MKNKKGFTLIEILIVVSIIMILSSIILVNINNSRKNARIKSAMTSAQSSLNIIVSCNDAEGTVTVPPVAGDQICDIIHPDSKWAPLPSGYTYDGTGDFSHECDFNVNGDGATINCQCETMACIVL